MTSTVPFETAQISGEHAWDPGLESTIPGELMPQVTLFRPENAFISYAEARELAEFCGLTPADVAFFRPERLIVHELLIRVTADLYVPDGPNYEDLGISLRGMVDKIYRDYVLPRLDEILPAYEDVKTRARDFVETELDRFYAPAASDSEKSNGSSFLGRLFGGRKNTADNSAATVSELDLINDWTARRKASDNPCEIASLSALLKVVGSIYGSRGRLVGDRQLVSDLSVRMICNDVGSEALGGAVDPIVREAADTEGYVLLPPQEKPVIMNVKGSSAAGKSTIRHDQMRLAKKLNVPWENFAVISPDYWRKYLLDYGSLGEHAKYAAMLTGQELEIVDVKLDRYMANKAARHQISHLLIDRFRFDSFLLEHERAADSKLLTRFGELVFMFFVITAPEATVERAYRRGIKTGRYKAVDDLLYHNVEAYTGMPDLFFSWASAEGKRIHYEFLDNNVAEQERPRTVAFGWNGDMVILDVNVMLEIDRYRKVNVKATREDEVFNDKTLDPNKNTGFLKRCARHLKTVTFADYHSGRVYGRLEAGKWVWRDDDYMRSLPGAERWQSGLAALGWNDAEDTGPPPAGLLDPAQEKAFTLGLWAPSISAAEKPDA
ncbi:MAG: hypothetical protein RIC16_12565 [Rhodospirillales bacterium]